ELQYHRAVIDVVPAGEFGVGHHDRANLHPFSVDLRTLRSQRNFHTTRRPHTRQDDGVSPAVESEPGSFSPDATKARTANTVMPIEVIKTSHADQPGPMLTPNALSDAVSARRTSSKVPSPAMP